MAGSKRDAAATWTSGTAFKIVSGSGHTIAVDGETQAGMSPMELLLASLIGCTGADVISILEKKRQAVTGFEVRVHGHRAESHPRVYKEIHVTFVVTGRGIDPEAVRRAIELSETKYCSVSAMLRAEAKIVMNFEIREAEPLAL